MFEPKCIEMRPEAFAPTDKTTLSAPRAARSVADRLRKEISALTGCAPSPASGPGRAGAIRLRLSKRLTASEAYKLTVTTRGVTLSASSLVGLEYAAEAFLARFDPVGKTFDGCVVEDAPAVPFRAHLVHLTHCGDPRWTRRRWYRKPFDLDATLRIVTELAKMRYKYVIVDVKDAVRFRSHPELARPWTQPMRHYAEIVKLARSLGMGVIPKLNFSKSPPGVPHHHNKWFRPYDRLPDNDEYFCRAFQLIDELIAVDLPEYFHIGMDEDFARPLDAYVRCIRTLRKGLKERGVRTMRWVDLEKRWMPREVRTKNEKAIRLLPKDIVNVIWTYVEPDPYPWVGRLCNEGYTVIGGSGGIGADKVGGKVEIEVARLQAVRAFTREIVRHNALGMISTTWLPLWKDWERMILDIAGFSARVYWNGG